MRSISALTIPHTGYKVYAMETHHMRHMDQLPRMKRIAGQVVGIQRMIEEGRYCMDILIQLRAVRAALKRVEGNILERHLKHCVAQAIGDPAVAEQKVTELQKYFEAERS